jgi:sulfide:quinone oxidoreductase
MPIQSLSPNFAVSPQIAPDELAAIAAAGFKSVICNRPDGEDPGQPSFDTVAQAAAKVGLQARHLPVVSGQFGQAEAAATAQLLRQLPQPILAYCRSGARSTNLWQLAQGL